MPTTRTQLAFAIDGAASVVICVRVRKPSPTRGARRRRRKNRRARGPKLCRKFRDLPLFKKRKPYKPGSGGFSCDIAPQAQGEEYPFRSLSISNGKPLTRREQATKAELDRRPELLQPPDWLMGGRPKSYEECKAAGLGIDTPCPFASCRYSLLVDLNRQGGLRVINPWWEQNGDESRPTCLNAESTRPRMQHEIGYSLGLTASSVEAISGDLLKKIKRRLMDLA